jgi:hypothetical protein
MGVSPRDFESRASTSFTTPATEKGQFQMPKSKCQINVKTQISKDRDKLLPMQKNKTQMSNQGQSSNAQRKKPIISF